MDTDELQGMMVEALNALRDLSDVNGRADEMLAREIGKLQVVQDELRDDLHAVANRVETLTRAMMIDAGEVAEKMIAAHTLRVVKPYDQDKDVS